MEGQKYWVRFRCLILVLTGLLVVLYWHRIRAPLQNELNDLTANENDESKYEAMRSEMTKKEKKTREQIEYLQKTYSLEKNDVEKELCKVLEKEFFHVSPSLQEFAIVDNTPKIYELDRRIQRLKSQIFSAGRNYDKNLRSNLPKWKNELNQLDEQRKKLTPGFHTEFRLPHNEIASIAGFLGHLSRYAKLVHQTWSFQPSDGLVYFETTFQTHPGRFLSSYSPYAGAVETFSQNPFNTPSYQEKRLSPQDVENLSIVQIFYNPAMPNHSLALLNNCQLVSPADEVGAVFIKEIHPTKVILGYYGEMTLSIQTK